MDEIQNCGWQFRFQCPMRWNQLAETSDPAVRQCAVCHQAVYRCDSPEQAAQQAGEGRCVALVVTAKDDGQGDFDGESILIGDFAPMD